MEFNSGFKGLKGSCGNHRQWRATYSLFCLAKNDYYETKERKMLECLEEIKRRFHSTVIPQRNTLSR